MVAEVLPSHYHHSRRPNHELMVHREILLSYRLLFGQFDSSRKLCSQSLTRDQAPTTQHQGALAVDPLLLTLCTIPLGSSVFCASDVGGKKTGIPGHLFPPSSLGFQGDLQESDTYSTHDDFPILGQRLLTLQRYSLRQRPSRMKDLWRDRRNPMQWYTFWPVIWVGGLSISIGFLQLLVSSAVVFQYLGSSAVVRKSDAFGKDIIRRNQVSNAM